MELYLVCEDSLEGIFSAVYEAYALRLPLGDVHIQVGAEGNLRLFAEYREVMTDSVKAAKVARAIGRELGGECYMTICQALASADSGKGEAILRTIISGRGMSRPREVMGNLTDPHVMKVFELARHCGRETHLLTGFIRFRELENGLLYARIGPKNNVLTFVMPHFADRMPQENFIIHDETRGFYGLHPAAADWFTVTADEGFSPDVAGHAYSEDEIAISGLFNCFFRVIAIEERNNPKQQRNFLPIRYREYMTEWTDAASGG